MGDAPDYLRSAKINLADANGIRLDQSQGMIAAAQVCAQIAIAEQLGRIAEALEARNTKETT